MRIRIAAVAGAIIAVWTLWAGISGSQIFEIESVEVTGTTRLSADSVVALAAVEEGETLLRIDVDAVTQRLLQDPWIAEADLSRRLPSTLHIDVRERTPAVVVDTGVTFWFVDGGGRVLSESVPDTGTALPVVRDLPDFVAEPGVVSDSRELRNALRVLSGLTADLAATVRIVSAPSVDETALLTASSVEIMMGEATRIDEKSALVTDILREQGDRVVFIDVRSVERPISRGLD